MTTNQAILDSCLFLLNEASTSSAPEYESDVSASPTYTSTAGLIIIANNGQTRLCTTCVAWQDTGTMTFTLNKKSLPLTNLSTTLGGTIWAPREVYWNGVFLPQTTQTQIDMLNASGTGYPSGTPSNWYPDGQYNIALYPYPTASQTLTVTGYAVPPEITSGTLATNAIWLQDGDLSALSYWMAAELARKNSEDTLLSGKVAEWEYESRLRCTEMYNRLDPSLRAWPFTAPPPLPQVESQLAS